MGKIFNIAGPCNPERHYMLSATERAPDVMRLVEDKAYFVVVVLLAAFGAWTAGGASVPDGSVVHVKAGGSLAAARDAARRVPHPAVVELAAGVYELTETLELTAADSDVTWRATSGARVTVTGGRRVTGWRRNADGTWSASVPKGKLYRVLTADGVRCRRCRAPNTGEFLAAGETEPLTSTHTLGPGRHPRFLYDPKDVDFAKLADPAAGEIRLFHWWIDSHHRIGSVDAVSNSVTFAVPDDTYVGKMFCGGKPCRYALENFRFCLDEPGEWYLDRAAGRIDYLPRPGEDPARTEFRLAETETLVRFAGEAMDPRATVRNVRFEGLRFADAHAGLSSRDPFNGEQGSAYVGAAVTARGARNCGFARCAFENLCGFAIDVNEGCRDFAVTRCRFAHLGAGAVRADGGTCADAPRRHTRGVRVEDCEIGDYGIDWASAVAVLLKNVSDSRVAHNRIHDGFYTAVSVGWTWGYGDSVTRGVEVEGNLIEDIGKGLLNDMGGIYTLGLQPGTRIRGNVVRRIRSWSYGGHCLYTDEGSQGILVENNVFADATGPIGIHYARELTIRNNVIALERGGYFLMGAGVLEPHVTAYCYSNVFYFDTGCPMGYRLAHQKGYPFRENPKTPEVTRHDHIVADWNAFWTPRGRDEKAVACMAGGSKPCTNLNAHSIWVDPGFADPEKGDFRMRNAAALAPIGFEPIDLDAVGPRPQGCP